MAAKEPKENQKTPNVNFINVESPINWDEYFMFQAILASYRSKDPSTKVGAVFVDQNHHQISMGPDAAGNADRRCGPVHQVRPW